MATAGEENSKEHEWKPQSDVGLGRGRKTKRDQSACLGAEKSGTRREDGEVMEMDGRVPAE